MKKTFLIILTLLSSFSAYSKKIDAEKVFRLTQKVADWQIKTFEDQGKYRAVLPNSNKPRTKHGELDWTSAAFYIGLSQFATISNNQKYSDWLMDMGNRHSWKLGTRMYHADDHAVGQFYLDVSEDYGKYFSNNIVKQFNDIIQSEQGQKWQWTWCDALFMSPPVWAHLSKMFGTDKYLNYMDNQYHISYNELWSKESHLFFRDKRYITKTEKNGKPLFWSRGNGWVFGGLALMIPYFPENWSGRQFYIDMFKEMAVAIKDCQRKDGGWSSGLLGDTKDYPTIEASGTGFFAFGLAWGLRNGILDKTTYEPVLLKAWKLLSSIVDKDGMVGYVQPVGASPNVSFANYTELYGTGAFLTAGTEIYKYAIQQDPKQLKTDKAAKNLFMHNGGWCWYQDPRVIISNGKLVMGGIDGQNGNVRIGVYDLKSNKISGELNIHENFQRDDHDTPAFCVRPDNSILAMWAKHGKEKIHYFATSKPDDYLSWSNVNKINYEYDYPAGVTYMNLFYLNNNKVLYNFFRNGLNFNPSFITSTDNGKTWSATTHFIANDVTGRNRPYARYIQIDDNTIGVSYTDAHPRNFGNSLYYIEYRNNAYYNVNGKLIKKLSDGVLHTSEGEKIYKGSETKAKTYPEESVPNSAWTCAMAKDKGNHPLIGYSLYLNNNDHRFRIATWDGNKWVDREIAYAGHCLYFQESSYTGLMTFDPTDPTKVYISTDVNPSTGEEINGIHEIYEATIGINDDIKTIKWKAVTSNSKERNIRPIVVAKDGYKVLLWLNGRWKSFVNYDVNVVGKILQRP